MRTLQEKYNAIQEGKFSKEHFLAEARMQQPQLITRFNGYDDAVQILKNRGMIVEAKGKEEFENPLKGHSDEYKEVLKKLNREAPGTAEHNKLLSQLNDMRREKGLKPIQEAVTEISSDTFKGAVDVARGRGENQRISNLGSTFLHSFIGKPLMGGKISKIDVQKPSFGGYFDVTLQVLVPTQGTQGMYDKPTYLYYDVEGDDWNLKGKGLEITRLDARVLSQIAIKVNPDTKYSTGVEHFDIKGFNEESLNEAKQPKATKKGLADYRYKPTNEMDKYPYEQILRGIRVELEAAGVHGTPTAEEYSKALAKVSKNLAKDSIFYTNQLAGVNTKVDLHDKMVPFTDKVKVDTFNGMKKAALKEGFKKLIKKVLSESMGDMFGDEERAQRSVNYGQPGENEYEFYSDPENYNEEEDLYEMQGAKEDSYYKNELAEYLDDNGIFGYTKRIHDIMTGPDEAENVDELVRYLEDNQIYGYNRGIEQIYADYPYDQHWMNQPDEDEADDISHPRGYEEDTDEEDFEDLFETVSLKDIL